MPDSRPRRAVILTNGVLADPGRVRWRIQPDDRLICADAGARHALAMGLIPDVVVGDMDSLSADDRAWLEAAGVRFEIHPARKDRTDLELAVCLAVDEGATQVDLMATMGGRLDQSLANLLLLTRPAWEDVDIRVIEGDEVAWLVREGRSCRVAGRPGDTLSLVPLTPVVEGVTLEGVEWPLSGAVLHLGSTLTLSNVMVDTRASLRISSGMVLVVHRSEEAPGKAGGTTIS